MRLVKLPAQVVLRQETGEVHLVRHAQFAGETPQFLQRGPSPAMVSVACG